jgi:hypothetical protein
VLAAIRPDSWNFPLFVHVFGAMLLVGTVAAGVTAELVAVRSEAPERLRQLAFRTFLLGGLPAFIVMHAGAEWIHSKEFPKGVDDPTWVGIGYITADGGGIVFLVALILAGVASRRSQSRLGQVAGMLAAVSLTAWLVAVWAMAGKPG